MKAEIKRVDIWAAGVEDRPGAVAEKLDLLARAGVNLEFIIARRAPEKPGEGVIFITPVRGSRQIKAAKEAGFEKTSSLFGIRITAADKPGLGASVMKQIADTGVNVRGLSAMSVGKKAVFYLAFDNAEDAGRASKSIK